MTGPARDVERFILKDGDRDFTARISFPEGMKPPDFTQKTLRHIVSPAINIWGAIPSSFLNGSKLTLEMKPSKSYGPKKKPSKRKKKTRGKK